MRMNHDLSQMLVFGWYAKQIMESDLPDKGTRLEFLAFILFQADDEQVIKAAKMLGVTNETEGG